MLENATRAKIIEVTNQFWFRHVKDPTFMLRVTGKEAGHQMADYVDQRTTEELQKIGFDVRDEATARGKKRLRSMGDVWIRSGGVYNPINIKAGEQKKKGQPNLVAMQKLLDYLFKRWIDSYYLLIVKFQLNAPIEHKAYLIDLLDWLDFTAYDAGPGQVMLREHDFYAAYENEEWPEPLSIAAKVEKLYSQFEKGIRRLFKNREKRVARQHSLFTTFVAGNDCAVDQSTMHFVGS
ncbi:MAG: hypothetical protein WCB27_07675 [Thermoguttaceae bacterium]